MKTHIITDCGHQFNTGYDAVTLAGATMDCRICDELLIFPRETTIGTCVRGRAFHVYLNERDRRWPADGRNTYSVAV